MNVRVACNPKSQPASLTSVLKLFGCTVNSLTFVISHWCITIFEQPTFMRLLSFLRTPAATRIRELQTSFGYRTGSQSAPCLRSRLSRRHTARFKLSDDQHGLPLISAAQSKSFAGHSLRDTKLKGPFYGRSWYRPLPAKPRRSEFQSRCKIIIRIREEEVKR